MPEPLPFLVADLSNSFVKLALASSGAASRIISDKRKLPTAETTADALRATLHGWDFDHVVLASVVPEKTKVFAECFGTQLAVIDHSWDLGIGIEFLDPTRIGGDRLANSAALAELYGCPGVVIDFGTAVTFDIVDDRRCYTGGVIAPGLSAMTDYLHEKTALLPRIELRQPTTVIGKSTEEAMLAGAFYGYHGLVSNLIRKIRETVAPDPDDKLSVVATGGYARLLQPGIPEIDHVDKNLTLEGVRIAGNRRFLGKG